jgi:flagellar basal body-associated protein FliL
MKKIIAVVITVLLITALLASCAGTSSTGTAYNDYQSGAGAAPAVDGDFAEDGKDAPAGEQDVAGLPNGTSVTSGTIGATISGDKIIYNFNATVETTKFDDTLKNLNMLLGKYGAFVETSYISGSSYGYSNYHSASFTIRVPVSNFKGMTDSLTLLGNVINANTTSQNITAQFIDTQSRLNAYKTEESRLLAMLEKAATVTDMITIESRLSDVRYQIESLTSTLQNWQNQVDFSTVTLQISEVEELTEQKPIQRTYWEKMVDGLQSTLTSIGDFFKGFFMVIVVILPVLLILAVIAVIIIIIVRSANKKKRARMQQQPYYPPMNQPNQPGPYQPGQMNQNIPPNQNNDKKE